MKNYYALLFILSLVITACSPENDEIIIDQNASAKFIAPPPGNIDTDVTGTDEQIGDVDLIAGQNIISGIITVTLINNQVVVNYIGDADWEINETHLYIGELSELPVNGAGNPQIGQFPYTGTHDPGTDFVSYTGLYLTEGNCTYIAAHAVVTNTLTGQEETAWGEGQTISLTSWAMTFEVCN